MVGLLWELFNLLKEVANRVLKLPEFLLTLVGAVSYTHLTLPTSDLV